MTSRAFTVPVRVAQRRGEPAQYCRAHKKLLNRFRLTADYLVGQEIHDIAITAGKVTGKIGRSRVVAERQRRQVQTGGPSFRSLDKLGQVMVAQFDGGHL